MTISTSNFKFNVEPILNETFDGIYNAYPREYTEVFTSKTGIQRAVHEEPVLYQFGLAAQKGQGDVINYDDAGTAGNAKYVYAVYSLAFSLTEELMEDGDHANILDTLVRGLAFSMHYTKELSGANIFNNGFNPANLGYDNQPLFSTQHVNGLSGIQSNTLPNPTPLSQAGLEQILVNIRKAQNGRGMRIALKAMKLVFPPELIFQAERLLSSVLQSGTTNNDVNAVKSLYKLDSQQLTRLSSPYNWFVTTDSPSGLQYLDRRPINTQSIGDFDTGNMRYRSTMRYAFGWTDFLGAFGVQGVA